MSQETCIGIRFLRAIEEEDFNALPGGVFDRGFIRTYAKRLGLDPEAKVSEYAALTSNERIPEPAKAYDTSELHIDSTADSGTREPAPTDDASGADTQSTADSGTPEPAPTDDASDLPAGFTDEAGTPELKTLTDLSIATLRLQPQRQPAGQMRPENREDTRGGLVGRIWDYEFSHAEQSVLQAMADHAKDDGSDCVPGLRRVAYKARMSERHVRRIWRDLEKRHILLLESGGNGRGHIGQYRICLDNAKRRPSFETWLKSQQVSRLAKAEQLPLEVTGRKDDIDSETPKTPTKFATGDSESKHGASVSRGARQDADPIEDKPIQH